MGGLVVKKACILSQSDPQYKDMMLSTTAIVFLSTPHRGTNLAEVLNRILSVSVFNHSAKQYIAELNRNSSAIHDINEQFKNIAPRLQLASLYETQQTPIGPRKVMVLEKDSSILGYPSEISKPLDADHHNVCKFVSPEDPNYISVRNILRSLISQHPLQGAATELSLVTRQSLSIVSPLQAATTEEPLPTGSSLEFLSPLNRTQTIGSPVKSLPPGIVKLLGVEDPPNDDYEFFHSRWMPGSCEWIQRDPSFERWLDVKDTSPQALYVHGVPGAGKSILSSYIVSYLRGIGSSCQFFFFRFGDQAKISINTLLRSLAYQVATDLPMYEEKLLNLAEETSPLDKADTRVLWHKLFMSRLFKLRLTRPLYWVIDALDECDAPEKLLALLSSMPTTRNPIRILFVGRKTNAQSVAFLRLGGLCQVHTICIDNFQDDLQRYVQKEMEYLRGRAEFKARISKKILDAANGNFLWVTLVMNDVAQCHTETAIEQTLDELPAELEPLYQRMESLLASSPKASNRGLTKAILTWVTCSSRPLTIEELAQALMPEYSGIFDLEHTAVQLCGGFVVVDNKRQVVMVHQTAREYLIKTPGLQYSILPRSAHRDLFVKCVTFLSTLSPRTRSDLSSLQPFVMYAATSWFYHLALIAALADHTQLITLAKFLQGSSVLSWINLMASDSHLRNLLYASQSMMSYLKKQAVIDAERSPMTQRLQEKELIEYWSVDLIRLVGKFGSNLVRHPRSIYAFIPAFCPSSSMIYRQFWSMKGSSALSVAGLSSDEWDDCLGKFSIPRNSRPVKITCSDNYLAILTSEGTITLYRAATYEVTRKFMHGERVLCFSFGDSWRLLVTYGFLATKVWDVQSGRQLHSFRNPSEAKAQAVSFHQDEDMLISCSDDRAIRRAILDRPKISWDVVEPSPGGDSYDGRLYNSPKRVAINADGLQVAIAYRGFPLLVWGVDPPGLIGRCERVTDRSKSRHDLWTDFGPICWNPTSGHVLGLYNDGCIFKWHPIEQDSQELKAVAADIRCGPSGNLFVTSNVDGTLKIWNFQHFALVYKLSCHTPVTDLSMSPDGRRIYDLRDSFCNIWEPNALLRLAETDDKASETSSTLGSVSQASEAVSEMSDPITALAVNPLNFSYCIGDEAGSLRLHECGKDTSTMISQTFMAVDHASWSDDGTILATADLGSRLSVWVSNPRMPVEEPSLSFDAKIECIQQLVINRSSEYLFVAVQGFIQLWSISSKEMITSQISLSHACRWVSHPTRYDTLLQIDYANIKLLQWSNLLEIRTFSLDRGMIDIETQVVFSIDVNPTSPSEETNFVDKVFVTSDGSQLLCQTFEVIKGQRPRRQIILIPSPELDDPNSVIQPQLLPPLVEAQIDVVLGFASWDYRRPSYALSSAFEDLLVFLDREFWVCTWALSDKNASSAKRHFFLPQDWLNAECFGFSTVSRDGTLFIPRNGEVAVIRNGLREEWFE